MLESLYRDLVVIHSWCLKLHMKLNPKKTKFQTCARGRTCAPVYGDLTLGGTEFMEVNNGRILEVNFDSKLTLDTQLHEVVLKAVGSLGVVRRARKLFDCPRALKSCFNSYVLSNLEYCSPM